jgi:MoaA/NifB/PqqE/SkfB family radical SAM enzyme
MSLIRLPLLMKNIFRKTTAHAVPGDLQSFDTLLYWDPPQSVFLDITNHCNLRCRMCPHSMKEIKFEKGHMGWEFFRKVIAQVQDVQNISLYASGEPLIARNWERILDYFLENEKFSGRLSFTTNGLLLTEKKAEKLAGRTLAISVSIDGGTKHTYEGIRQGGNFELLMKNLFSLRDMKRQMGTDQPALSFSFVAWKDNIAELPLVIQLASELEVKQVTLIHRIFYAKEDFDSFSLCNHKALFDRCLEESLGLAERLGITLTHTGSFSRKIAPTGGLKETYFKEIADNRLSCRVVDEHVIIGPKGLVRACCFIDKLFMGNLNYDAFGSIWNGPNYRNLRLDLYRGAYPEGCSHCSFLQVLQKEEVACICPLNTGEEVPLSPEIKQAYDIITANEEFQHAMADHMRRPSAAGQTIAILHALWERDHNLFEIANNLAVLHAMKGDPAQARAWTKRALEVMPYDAKIGQNAKILGLT